MLKFFPSQNSRNVKKYWFLHLFYLNKSRQICLYLGSLFSQKLTCQIIEWNVLKNCLPLTFKFKNIRIKGWIFSVLAENSSLSDQNMETLPNKFVGHGDKHLPLFAMLCRCAWCLWALDLLWLYSVNILLMFVTLETNITYTTKCKNVLCI